MVAMDNRILNVNVNLRLHESLGLNISEVMMTTQVLHEDHDSSFSSLATSYDGASTLTEHNTDNATENTTENSSPSMLGKRKRFQSRSISPPNLVILEYLEAEYFSKPWKRRAVEKRRLAGKGQWPGRGRTTWKDLGVENRSENHALVNFSQQDCNSEESGNRMPNRKGPQKPNEGASVSVLSQQITFDLMKQPGSSISQSTSPARKFLRDLEYATPSVVIVMQDRCSPTQEAKKLLQSMLVNIGKSSIPVALKVSDLSNTSSCFTVGTLTCVTGKFSSKVSFLNTRYS